jgi:hypothetical protein
MTSQKPIKDFRVGGIQASIWRKEVPKNGYTAIQYSVKIEKRYRKKDGEYQNTDYYFDDDLPKLILAAQKAYEYIAVTERGTDSNEA